MCGRAGGVLKLLKIPPALNFLGPHFRAAGLTPG